MEGRVSKFSVQVSTLSPKASFVQVHFLSTTVQSTGSFVTERLYSLRYESYSVFHVHVLVAKHPRFQSQMFTLSRKASCVQTHFLSNYTVTWDFCDRPLLQLTV